MSALQGDNFSRIIFKCGMEVYYGKTKRPIVFGVGGVSRCHGNDIFCKILVSDATGCNSSRTSSNLVWRCVMQRRRRVLVFGVGGVIVAMVPHFWRKFACFTLATSSSPTSSNLAWRCVMVSRRRPLVFGVGGVIVAMVTPFFAEIFL